MSGYAQSMPFPDPRVAADEDGIVAVSERLTPRLVLEAYRQGIFPWPMQNLALTPWFCPPQRAILEFKNLHLPRSLKAAFKKARAPASGLRLTRDLAFASVIDACGQTPRPGQQGTWITPELRQTYVALHEQGHAHSIEVWDGGGALVGGIYGVDALGAFSAESMFHRTPNASKFALLTLIETLETQGGTWLDIQVQTPHLKALGAHEVSRDAFLKLLARTQAQFASRGGRVWPQPERP